MDRDGFQPIWAQIICGDAKDTELYKWFVEITQKGEFPELFYIAGFVRDEKVFITHDKIVCNNMLGIMIFTILCLI